MTEPAERLVVVQMSLERVGVMAKMTKILDQVMELLVNLAQLNLNVGQSAQHGSPLALEGRCLLFHYRTEVLLLNKLCA